MQQKILLSFIFNFLFALGSMASHMAGGEITYKYLGSERFEVTFKIYRDCRGGAINNFNFQLNCISSNYSRNIYPTLISIRDLTKLCDTSSKKCYPPNKSITSSNPLFEEHLYKDTLDLNNAEIDFKYCCLLKIGMGQCCRGSGLTTGGAGDNFWVTSTLDLCKAPNNSSPEFSSSPNFIICCNQLYYGSFNAIDTSDNDSISYSLIEPMQTWTAKVNWTGARNYKSPLSDYYPSGYDKNKGPKPDADPPIGTYLDPETGILILTPTDCSEITKIAVSAKEWRKDSTGKYIQIGEIIRDVVLNVIQCPSNNPPLLAGPNKYEVCAGNNLCFTIVSDDKQFIPAPPNKPSPPDTVNLTWNKGNLKGASFSIVDPKARLKKLRFCWKPTENDVNDLPYTFSVSARDNSCPLNAITTKSYTVKVKPIAKTVVSSIKHITNNSKLFESQIIQPFKGTPVYQWQVLDSLQKPLTAYSYFFKKSKSTISRNAIDTVIFRKAGKYIIRHVINNPPNNCPTTYFDTLTIPKVIDVSFFKTMDTLVCKGASLKFKAAVVNGTAPHLYQWGKGIPDTISQLSFTAFRDTTIELAITDSKGLTAYSWVNIKIKTTSVNAGPDKITCKNDTVSFIAFPSNFSSAVSFEWIYKGTKIGFQNLLNAAAAGKYTVQVSDSTGCFSKDSVLLSNFPSPVVAMIDGSYCQDKNVLIQPELIRNSANLNIFKNVSWQLLKTLKNPKGTDNTLPDLLTDLDTTAKYNFSLAFDKSKIDLGLAKKDSLIFLLTVTDSNKCIASDTGIIVIKKTPGLDFKYSQKSICRNDGLDLDSLINSDGDELKLEKVNVWGYTDFTSTGIAKDGILIPSDFQIHGGLYKINVLAKMGDCESNGSMTLYVLTNPIPVIEKQEGLDSVIFTDKSFFGISRSWYLDAVFISDKESITLAKKQADGKSITLRLVNGICTAEKVLFYFTSGVRNLKTDLIKIYPNPVNQTLTIETNQNKPYQIKVMNTLGQLVILKDMDSESNTLDVTNLRKGIYFLEIAMDSGVSRLRFVKE